MKLWRWLAACEMFHMSILKNVLDIFLHFLFTNVECCKPNYFFHLPPLVISGVKNDSRVSNKDFESFLTDILDGNHGWGTAKSTLAVDINFLGFQKICDCFWNVEPGCSVKSCLPMTVFNIYINLWSVQKILPNSFLIISKIEERLIVRSTFYIFEIIWNLPNCSSETMSTAAIDINFLLNCQKQKHHIAIFASLKKVFLQRRGHCCLMVK